jgi:uncharacterized protein (TIGR02996 family)
MPQPPADLDAAFLQAIAADPDDDANRLIYADWLDEQGRQEDAVMARVECALALGGGVTLRFAAVRRGTFWMGGSSRRPGDQQVTFAQGFGLGVYAVTQEQWRAVMGDNPSRYCRDGDGKERVRGIMDADLARFPVEQVSWEDVQRFLARLNHREQGRGWLYRLPTEAEWEYACRGGPSTREDSGFDFYLDRPTNDLSSTQANFDGNHPGGDAPEGPYLYRPSKVGSYAPNSLGLYDMHGNVSE